MDNPFIQPRPVSDPLAQRILAEVFQAMGEIHDLEIIKDYRGVAVRKDMLAENIREACLNALTAQDRIIGHYQKGLAEVLAMMPPETIVVEKERV
jgi:hypothetical protein